MIKVITGKLGAGKTLFAVTEIYDLLCKGRTVATNIALNWPELCALAKRHRGRVLDRRQWLELDPGKNPDWQHVIPWGVQGLPVAVYLDEIHLFFNARDWAETAKLHRGLLSFLTQSRKACVDVTFIAQEISTIEKQFRVLAEWEYYAVSTDHMPLGPLGKLPFKAFIVAVRDANHGYLVKRIWKSYDKRFFRLYGSFTFLDAEMNGLAAVAVRVEPFKLERVSYLRRFLLDGRAVLVSLLPIWRFLVGKPKPVVSCAS